LLIDEIGAIKFARTGTVDDFVLKPAQFATRRTNRFVKRYNVVGRLSDRLPQDSSSATGPIKVMPMPS
jgi:hypothetical protein